MRENTEGLYSGLEHVVVPGVVESLRIVTRAAAERIVRFAFELARREGRRRVTFCHKADVMPLVRRPVPRLAPGRWPTSYPFIEFEERHIDNLCLELALDPTRFDVLVMENLFGDVHQRPVRRAGRRAGPGAGGEHRHALRGVRGGPRQRPGHRRARGWPTRSR